METDTVYMTGTHQPSGAALGPREECFFTQVSSKREKHPYQVWIGGHLRPGTCVRDDGKGAGLCHGYYAPVATTRRISLIIC